MSTSAARRSWTLNYTTGVVVNGASGAAYTNNDLHPNTATTLFDLDTTLDQLAIQSPPNAGSLVATGKLTFDAGAQVGFDIYSVFANGRVRTNLGFASVSFGDVSRSISRCRWRND